VNRPSVKFTPRKSILDSSNYKISTQEISVLDTPSWIGSLYHEYRHHWQFQNLPSYIVLWANIGLSSTNLYLILIFICLMFKLKTVIVGLSIVYMILILPAFAFEMDANWFTIRRLIAKKRNSINFISIIISILTYSFVYVYFPINAILEAINK
jgi:hypothetical protein